MAGFFPVFFKQYWSAGADATITTAKLGSVLSLSSLIIAVLSPTLGVMADLKGAKKAFCALFMLIGAACCLWMALIPLGGWMQAMWAYGLAMVAFAASCVFYDALLPSVARGVQMDDASSLGYGLGYLGGGVLFAINVVVLLKPAFFGLPEGDAGQVLAIKWAFASVAIWWLFFSIPLWKNVPEPASEKRSLGLWPATRESIVGLRRTLRDIRKDRNLFFFLLAFWMYIDGVYTVMTMAVDFGLSIGLGSSDLMTALLMVQFIAFPSTVAFGKITGRFGCRKPILLCIGIYAVTVVLATRMSTTAHFFLLAAVIGLVQGGVQSLSRSLFGHMVPPGRTGEFFGFFNLIGKFASIVGPLVVAVTVLITGNSRYGMLGLLILFTAGGWLLWKVQERPISIATASGDQL
ncbi:MAG: MFS transporter [Bdellovibrionaceae bacterium]|nr:MFS transporter [Pseudobdellovibrionaceae bacterium]